MSTSQSPSGTVPVASAGVDTSSPLLTLGGMYPVRKIFYFCGVVVLVGLWAGWAVLALLVAVWAGLAFAAGRGEAIIRLQFFETGLVVVKGQGFLSEEYEAYEVPWGVVEEFRFKTRFLTVKHHDERLHASLGNDFKFFPVDPDWGTDMQKLEQSGLIPKAMKFTGLKAKTAAVSAQPQAQAELVAQEAQAG